jgi:hypothetical protein
MHRPSFIVGITLLEDDDCLSCVAMVLYHFRNSRLGSTIPSLTVTMVHYVLAVIAALGAMAITIEAGTASASLAVGVTVVRSCKVESGGTIEAVRLACSKDVAPVNISSAAPQVLTLTGGDGAVRLVTLNF